MRSRELSRFAPLSNPSSVVRKISTAPLSAQAKCKASNSLNPNISSCLPLDISLLSRGIVWCASVKPISDSGALVQIGNLLYLIYQHITGNPIPMVDTKLRNNPADNFGLLTNSSLRLIIKKPTQTTCIKINFPELHIRLHAYIQTSLNNFLSLG